MVSRVVWKKRNGAFFRLVKCTTSRPPWQAATGGTRHGHEYQGRGASSGASAWLPQRLIHQHVRVAIELAVHEELRAALGATPYERSDVRRGYRNGTKARTLTGPTGAVLASLREGGEELLTFFTFPKAQWKTLRTTNTIERLHEEFRRRVKTQGSLPSEDAAVVLLFSLLASGQIKLRKIDGWQKIATVLSQHNPVAA